MKRDFVAKARNGYYAVDETRDGKVVRCLMTNLTKGEADTLAALLWNAYHDGAADQAAGTYEPPTE